MKTLEVLIVKVDVIFCGDAKQFDALAIFVSNITIKLLFPGISWFQVKHEDRIIGSHNSPARRGRDSFNVFRDYLGN